MYGFINKYRVHNRLLLKYSRIKSGRSVRRRVNQVSRQLLRMRRKGRW